MDAELALAFSAGMVATVNPCGFALLPAYLSYFLGLSDKEGDQGQSHNPILRALAVSVAVTAGFLVVFGVLGFAWSSVSELIGRRLPYFTIVVGIGLVILGIAMLRGFEPIVQLPKLDLGKQERQLGSMFLYGVSYAVASLSCTIPIFIGIVSTTLRHTSFAAGVATFLAYGLGMGMTLSLLTISVALAKSGLVRAFRGLLPRMNQISGVLLILAGAFVSYYAVVEISELNAGDSSAVVDWTRDLQGSMQRWVEQVGGARLALGAGIVIAAAVALSVLLRVGRPNQRSDGDVVPPNGADSQPDASVGTDSTDANEAGSPEAENPLHRGKQSDIR